MLEKILKNSEDFFKFEAPDNVTLFFPFDNIQKLLKSHRIGGEQQKQRLAVVVCSILCLLPDGLHKCDIQYFYKNSPANWLSSYRFESEKNIVVDHIQSNTLKNCLKIEKDEAGAFNEIFENDLKTALEYVEKDMSDNLQDSIDDLTKSSIAKKRKL